ncbi:unnamed protein product [Phaeothamnion confervicola]
MYLQAKRFATNHADLVHDVRYDHYGKRLATCSSDQTVRVWDLDDNGDWHVKEGGEWKNAHQGMIFRLVWAHPEFGQVLATCSADKTIKIWKPLRTALRDMDSNLMLHLPLNYISAGSFFSTILLPVSNVASGIEEGHGQARWYPKAQLSDSRKPVMGLEFAPRHVGLKLAAASADGCVRVYEALDAMNLSHWPVQEVFEPDSAGGAGVTCLSWNKSRFEQASPMLVLGTDTGRSWVWRYDGATRAWQMVCELERHDRMVCDVDWAPAAGRSFHLIATAGRDNKLKVCRFVFRSCQAVLGGMVWSGGVHRLRRAEVGAEAPREPAALLLEGAEVWRVSWNVTGTVLVSSGSDPEVRVWKQNFRGEWQGVARVAGDLGASGSSGGAGEQQRK